MKLFEQRLRIAVSVEYTIEELKLFDMIQNLDVLKDIVSKQWVPSLPTGTDPSSLESSRTYIDPDSQFDVNESFDVESRNEEVVSVKPDEIVLRITETGVSHTVWSPGGGLMYAYPGAGTSTSERGSRFHDIIFRPGTRK